MNNIRLKILIVFLVVSYNMFSQVIGVKHQFSKPAKYNAIITTDTFKIKADTLFIFNDSLLYINSLQSNAYLLLTDTIFSDTAKYYIKSKVYKVKVPDTTYMVVSPDTVSFIYRKTSYYDSIYVFVLPNESNKKIGKLKVIPPIISGNSTFNWYRFIPTKDSLKFSSTAFFTETATDSSVYDSLASGGYKIHIKNASLDTSLYAWVYNYYFNITTNLTNTCDYVSVLCTANQYTFRYYNLNSTKDSILLPNGSYYTWSATGDQVSFRRIHAFRTSIDPRPLEDNTFKIEVKDSFNIVRTSTLTYTSKQTKAEAKIFYKDGHAERDNPAADYEESEGEKEITGSAPMRVIIKNDSKKSAFVEYDFGDTILIHDSRAIGTTQIEYDTSHVYFVPRKYSLKIISYSKYDCTDTLSLEDKVMLDTSTLQAPNFFSPNKDGFNDYFRIYDMSLKFFEINIYDRWGKKIYTYIGDINNWQGWDGKIKESDREAVPGVYYYVVRGTGWEKNPPVTHQGKKYTGFFHLYR